VRITRPGIEDESPDPTSQRLSLVVIGGLLVIGALLLIGAVEGIAPSLPVTSLPRRLWAQARDRMARDAVPDLRIDVPFRDYQHLLTMRERALDLGYVERSEDDRAAARLSLGERAVDATLFFPEGRANRLEAEDRWPLLGRVRDGGTLMGARTFSLTPADRETFRVAAYLAALRDRELPAGDLHLVRLWINGRRWGIYALEGFYEPSSDPGGGVWVAFDPAAYLKAEAAMGGDWSGRGFRYARPTTANAMGPQADLVADTPALAAARSDAVARLEALASGRLRPAEAFDPEVMGEFLALTTLWRGAPTLNWCGLWFAYDPQSGRFTPIGTRAGTEPAETRLPPMVYFDDPEIQRAYLLALREIADPATSNAMRPALEMRWAGGGWHLTGASDFDAVWEALLRHQAQIRRMIEPARTLYADADERDGALVLRLRSTQAFPVEVVGLDLGGILVPPDRAWVQPAVDRAVVPTMDDALVLTGSTGTMASPVELHIPLEDLPMAMEGRRGEIHVVTRLWGLDDQRLVMPVRDAHPMEPEGP
jgi:hypothetical protein